MPSPTLTLGSFLVAIMVGLTGMGGGALLTPMLMLVFGVPPLAAVSSDLVVSAITKPIGALVHLRRGTVNLRLAGWLSIGSVPSAFLGGLLGWWLGPGSTTQTVTARATGVVLIIAAAGVTARTVVLPALRRRRNRSAPGTAPAATAGAQPPASQHRPARVPGSREVRGRPSDSIVIRKIPTVPIGIIVGLAVGVTSTGSGTLVIAALAVLYPALPAGRLVGTDLAQAVPMVLAAALAHIVAGDVQMSVTTPLLIGGIPGVIIGSLLASRAPGGLLRPVLGVVVLASGLSLLGLSPTALAITVGVIAAALLVMAARSRLTRQRQPEAPRQHEVQSQPEDRRQREDHRQPRDSRQGHGQPRDQRAGQERLAARPAPDLD